MTHVIHRPRVAEHRSTFSGTKKCQEVKNVYFWGGEIVTSPLSGPEHRSDNAGEWGNVFHLMQFIIIDEHSGMPSNLLSLYLC